MLDYSDHLALRAALARVHHMADLKAICRDLCARLGVDYFLFCVCEAVSLTSPRIVRLTNFPEAWIDTMTARGRGAQAAVDPLLRHSFNRAAPVLWSELAHPDVSDSDTTAFFDAAASFGLRHGLTVPLNPPGAQAAFFSLATDAADADQHRLGNLLPAASLFGTHLFDAYTRIDKVENPKVGELTERELECVFWACEGKTAWEMAQIVGVAERTINFHLTSVIKKLGAANRQHAVAKAVMCGLVQPRH